MNIRTQIGPVTAYADAVAAGYTGTREQWAEDMAKLGNTLAEVRTEREAAIESIEQAAAEKVDEINGIGAVRFDGTQELTTEQQTQARANIGAASADEVGKLSEEITDLTDTVLSQSKNLFDVSKITTGYFVNQSTGVLSAATNHNVSDFIEIEPNTTYTISAQKAIGTNAQIRYFQYDGNKNAITGSGAINTTNFVSTFTSHEAAKYVRLSYAYHAESIMLEQGGTATEYQEYFKPQATFYTRDETDRYFDETKEEIARKYIANPEIFKVNLPEKLYATVGIELNVYFDNIVETHDTDYIFTVDCDVGMQLQRGYRYTPVAADVGNHTFTISVTNYHGQLVEKTSTIIVTAESVSTPKTVKMLVLGDSTTAGGTTVEKIHKNFENTGVTVQTLGTRGIAPYNHEGRSGWAAGTYVGSAAVNDVVNAFYNNGFDASYYFSQNNIPFPDWFIINLGINDLFSYTDDVLMNAGIKNFITRINTMIDSIREASSAIKIGLALTIPPNYSQDAFGKTYTGRQTRMRYKRNNFYLVNTLIETYTGKESTDNIYIIPIHTNLDTVYNMGIEEIPVNARNATTYQSPIGNGGVHPVESGYWQTADVYTAFIKANI